MRKHSSACCALLLGALTLATPGLADSHSQGKEASFKEVKQETRELVQALETYSIQQRDQALKKSRDALEDLDSQINALENHIDKGWEEMTRPVQQDARKSLRVLRRLRLRVAEYYGGLQASSAEAWSEMKTGFSNAYEDLYQAWQRSLEEFDNNRDNN